MNVELSLLNKELSINLASRHDFVFASSDPNDLVHWLNLLCLQKKGGSDSKDTKDEITAVVYFILVYEWLPIKKKCNPTVSLYL